MPSQLQMVPHLFLGKAGEAVTYLGCAENTLWKRNGWEQQEIVPIRNYASPPSLNPHSFIACCTIWHQTDAREGVSVLGAAGQQCVRRRSLKLNLGGKGKQRPHKQR